MANSVAGDGHAGGGGNVGRGARPQRLPRWTPRELRVLVQGKKLAETRSRSRVISAGEPKWTAVSDYCRRHGVERSQRQCRKRWDNLARDYKRIKVWECRRRPGGGEVPFWAMTNERRREQGLPGFFDKVVYEMLEGAREGAADDEVEDEEPRRMLGAPPLLLAAAADEGPLFDSGRAAAEDGLFSDFEEDEEEEEVEDEEDEEGAAPLPPTLATPISEMKPQQYKPAPSDSGQSNPKNLRFSLKFDIQLEVFTMDLLAGVGPTGMEREKQPANTEKVSSSGEEHKRKRTSLEDSAGKYLQNQLMEILERNSRTLAAHLEAQSINWQQERDQRKEHTERLVGVLSKLADALGRIADNLPMNGDHKI